ncbi:hypothetical protein WN943_018341 [Citrus x changshan-huyou]
MEEDRMKDEAKAFAKEDRKTRGQVKAFTKGEDKKKRKDDVNPGGILDRMIPKKKHQQQQEGEGGEEQSQNVAPSQEQIKDVTVQQYHDILSEDINLLSGLSKAIRNYCGRQNDARFEKLIADYREIVDFPSRDFTGLGERLCKLQKDYKLTDPVDDKMKDQVNLGGGVLDRVIPTQDEQLLVVMDKDKAKRDILEAMRLLWDKIISVQDSTQQQPVYSAPSEEESKEKDEEEEKKQMGDIQSEKKNLDSAKIAKNDQEEKEVGDGFGGVEQLLPKWEEMEKRETKK